MLRLINKLKSRKGFTLIELIVVLAVLAIIAAIAIPRFLGVQEQAKKDADVSTAAMIGKAAELYAATNPTDSNVTLSDLTTGGKYIDTNTKFQYYYNDASGADVDIDINSGVAKVGVKKASSDTTYSTLYPKPTTLP